MGALDSFGDLIQDIIFFILGLIVIVGIIIFAITGGSTFVLSQTVKGKEKTKPKNQDTSVKPTKEVPSKKSTNTVLKGCLIATVVGIISIILVFYYISNMFKDAFSGYY